MTAYPSGLAIDVALAVRRAEMTRQRWTELQEAIWGDRHGPAAASTAGSALRWGVELADGRRTSTLNRMHWRPDAPAPPAPVLMDNDGSGSGGMRLIERSSTLWLWPLPEGEALSLVAQWPALEVPVTTTRLDLAPVHAAAQQAVPFWP